LAGVLTPIGQRKRANLCDGAGRGSR
jgi:hypothetical protein